MSYCASATEWDPPSSRSDVMQSSPRLRARRMTCTASWECPGTTTEARASNRPCTTRGPQRPACDAAFRRVHRSARQEPDRFHATPAGVRHDTLARLARHRLGNCNWPRLVCPASSSGPAWSKVAWTMLQCRTPCCNERLAPRPGFHFRAAGSSGYSHGDGPCHQQRVRRKHPRSSLCSMQHAACSMQHAACSMQ